MYQVLKPLLFRLEPERAHHLTVRGLAATLATPGLGQVFRSTYRFTDPALHREVFGLPFANPVGLAAGFDKDGKYYRNMASLGFGFLELGTVTPRPQVGNPQPRLFRLPLDRALINRMGFNNEGVDALARRLAEQGRPGQTILGGNIGKNKDTPNEAATADYLHCFERLFALVDYFVVNVSSPNTPNLRELQDRAPLTALLTTLQERNEQLARPGVVAQAPLGQPGTLWQRKPILLKIAPDLTEGQLDDILQIVADTGIAGIIATNTTIAREPLQTAATTVAAIGAGGLSGAPVRQRSTGVIRYLYENSGRQLDIIGVGGIDGPAAAQEKLAAGARLIQVYSGMVYAGPGLVRDIKRSLVSR
ncbi:quinone-dependent dihydroorotate dehydrogenase [Neolewinella lacunae]|uniref:Dihydroorotate dehydrogenase (quinone) n=1 Tax=Neolewinella lacunae TaxID=1517758 RepID=A0A923PS61_9BACT|nr:quinone-dependent dihydroorotate dehydrogenase [Neolewinella lacunae]MBC6995797.1 quinone-dependent dihydroorotate dehydrogenase [Neolewinella lacunae]MDN3636510.1 quinone-dependent dihydroorotate dehydrogenase [Neolewinella lacunae]